MNYVKIWKCGLIKNIDDAKLKYTTLQKNKQLQYCISNLEESNQELCKKKESLEYEVSTKKEQIDVMKLKFGLKKE